MYYQRGDNFMVTTKGNKPLKVYRVGCDKWVKDAQKSANVVVLIFIVLLSPLLLISYVGLDSTVNINYDFSRYQTQLNFPKFVISGATIDNNASNIIVASIIVYTIGKTFAPMFQDNHILYSTLSGRIVALYPNFVSVLQAENVEDGFSTISSYQVNLFNQSLVGNVSFRVSTSYSIGIMILLEYPSPFGNNLYVPVPFIFAENVSHSCFPLQKLTSINFDLTGVSVVNESLSGFTQMMDLVTYPTISTCPDYPFVINGTVGYNFGF